MKIGIVTIISHNLGNRLQNYALQEYLKQYGIVETIPLKRKYMINDYFKVIIKKFLYEMGIKKIFSWEEMDTKIKWSRYICGKNDDKINKEYDYLVSGSDQVWNPLFDFNSDREFLISVQPEKRIAYAASIGIDNLPENEIERYRFHLKNMKEISVREESAATLVEKLINIRPPVLIDPTMLLDENAWELIWRRSKIQTTNRKYIVKYFLGKRSSIYDEHIFNVAKEMNAEIIEINGGNRKGSIECGPSDFLKLIHDASLVYTDSFHGTVFSILFKKDFFTFERPEQEGYGKMSSRINTLSKKFCINDRIIRCPEQVNIQAKEIDYKKIDLILASERNKAKVYLDKAFFEKKGDSL